jgi:hypothetical protein
MTHVLVVKEAYGDLRRGDTITDPDLVEKLSADAGHHFVKREATSAELAQIEAAQAEKAKAPKAKSTDKEAA